MDICQDTCIEKLRQCRQWKCRSNFRSLCLKIAYRDTDGIFYSPSQQGCCQVDIKLGHQTKTVYGGRKETKSGKATVLDEIWNTRFDDILLRLYDVGYESNLLEKWTKGCTLSFPKKGDLGITNNYRSISLIATAAEVYYHLLLNRI